MVTDQTFPWEQSDRGLYNLLPAVCTESALFFKAFLVDNYCFDILECLLYTFSSCLI